MEIRHPLRRWRIAPGFVVVSILTIAVGSGGVATAMSMANALLLRPLPGIRNPSELVEIRMRDRTGQHRRPMTYPTYEALRAAHAGLTDVAAAGYLEVGLSEGTDRAPKPMDAMVVSENYFRVLGVHAAMGQLFAPEDDRTEQPVAVLGFRIWQDCFGGDPSVIGRSVLLDRRRVTVIGVAQRGFRGHLPVRDFEVWVPLSTMAAMRDTALSTVRVLTVGRMANGVSVAAVRFAVDALARELRHEDPAEKFWSY